MGISDWIKFAALILTLATFLFGLQKYLKDRIRDFQKRFFEDQMKIYSEAVDQASSVLLYSQETDEYRQASVNFKKLYFGKMCLVENKEVASRMIQFKRLLDLFENDEYRERQDEIKALMEDFTIMLAHACRISSIDTWGIQHKYLPKIIIALSDIKKDDGLIDKLEESLQNS